MKPKSEGLKTIGIKTSDYDRIASYGKGGEPIHVAVTRILKELENMKQVMNK